MMRPSGPVVTWALTRPVLALIALSPRYAHGTGTIRPVSDVELYASYARDLVGGAVPYAEVAIEYPAGALPLVVGPELLARLPGVGYAAGFVLLALLLDLAGLIALRRLEAHWGMPGTGSWAWAVGLVLLGPLVLLRLDLLAVVAVLWAVERAAAGRWAATGGLLAFGGAVKLWPAGLLPAAAVSTSRWRRVLLGAAAVAVVIAVPTAGVFGDMLDASVLRNVDRGLQVETLWGSLLLAADAVGLTEVTVGFAAGADQVSGAATPLLLWLARAVPIAVIALGAWLAWPYRTGARTDATGRYVAAAEAATLLLVAGAAVLSAQFLLWAVGAVAAAACLPARGSHRRLLLVGAACVLTAVEFPWAYDGLKQAEPGPVAVVLVRNLLLVAAAVDAIRSAMVSRTLGRPPLTPLTPIAPLDPVDPVSPPGR